MQKDLHGSDSRRLILKTDLSSLQSTYLDNQHNGEEERVEFQLFLAKCQICYLAMLMLMLQLPIGNSLSQKVQFTNC